jgi:hypothetical protein
MCSKYSDIKHILQTVLHRVSSIREILSRASLTRRTRLFESGWVCLYGVESYPESAIFNAFDNMRKFVMVAGRMTSRPVCCDEK